MAATYSNNSSILMLIGFICCAMCRMYTRIIDLSTVLWGGASVWYAYSRFLTVYCEVLCCLDLVLWDGSHVFWVAPCLAVTIITELKWRC